MPVSTDSRGSNKLRYNRSERKARLEKNKKTLYHATSPQAAASINQTKKFLRGVGGTCGGGIYFGGSRSTAEQRSLNGNGAVFQCVVSFLLFVVC